MYKYLEVTALSRCPSQQEWNNSSTRVRDALGLRVHGRERRRPRAERRDVAAAPVQGAVSECMLCLHHLVNLRRALVDDRRTSVAEVALDSVLRGIPVRAEDLDCEVRCLEGALGRVP